MHHPDPQYLTVLQSIAERACENDVRAQWPEQDLVELAEIGAMGWGIGKEYGGHDLDAFELHNRYELLAASSLATALILSQRDAAAGFLEASGNQELKHSLLPKVAKNEAWTTIGISHLTTSHHSGSLVAKPAGNVFVMNGVIPWATGGIKSDFIVAGARTEGGQQLVFVLPTDRPGVMVSPPLKLATLSAAPTSPIWCKDVTIGSSLIIAGPAEKALATRKKSLPIGQAFAAFGLTRAAIELIKAIELPAAMSSLDAFQKQYDDLSVSVTHANQNIEAQHDLQMGPLLRSECNNLAIRATHAALTLYKGAGLRVDHPAQRIAREAMFLLVWSSPASVVDRNLELISDPH